MAANSGNVVEGVTVKVGGDGSDYDRMLTKMDAATAKSLKKQEESAKKSADKVAATETKAREKEAAAAKKAAEKQLAERRKEVDRLDREYAKAEQGKRQQAEKDQAAGAASVKSALQVAAVAAAAAGAAIVAGLTKAVMSFGEAQKGALSLSATIESNGFWASSAAKDYQEFAGAMAGATLTTRAETLALLKQAEAMGLHGEQAKRAAKNAVALAAQQGGPASGHLAATVGLEKGDIEGLKTIYPQLQQFQAGVNDVVRAQALLTNAFGVAKGEAAGWAGTLHKLQNEFAALTEKLGAVVTEWVTPLVNGITGAVRWVGNLSDTTKKWLAAGAAAVALAAGLGAAVVAAITFLGPAFAAAAVVVKVALAAVTATFGLILIPVAAIAVAVAAAGLAVYAWVKQVGGLAAAWEIVKRKAVEAWESTATARAAAASFFKTVWDVGVAGFNALADAVLKVFKTIGGDSTISWKKINDGLTTAFLMGEFAIKNFEKVWDLALSGVAVGVSELQDDLDYFGDYAVEVATYIKTNWWQIFKSMFTNINDIVKTHVGNIIGIITNLPELLSGDKLLGDVTKSLIPGFTKLGKDAFAAFNAPQKAESDTTKLLRQQFKEQAAALGLSFEEFRKNKMREFETPPDKEEYIKTDALNLGAQVGQNFNQGLAQAMQRFDAALYGSAEALGRIADYRDKMLERKDGLGKAAAADLANGKAAMPNTSGMFVRNPDRPLTKDFGKDADTGPQQVDLLKQAVEKLGVIAKNKGDMTAGAVDVGVAKFRE